MEIEGSGIGDQLYSYALKAHFDFVVADGSDGQPKFAVEFDEIHHRTDPNTVENDRKKRASVTNWDFPFSESLANISMK